MNNHIQGTTIIDLNNIFGSIIAVIGLTLFIVMVLAILAFCIAFLVAQCKLFAKCGYEWWKAIIPFYSEYVFFVNICGLHWAWFAGWLAVTFVSINHIVVRAFILFVNAAAYHNLAIRFDKDKTASMIFGALFPKIVNFVYAFGKGQYDGTIPVKESGLF